jgi:hypothetical protein
LQPPLCCMGLIFLIIFIPSGAMDLRLMRIRDGAPHKERQQSEAASHRRYVLSLTVVWESSLFSEIIVARPTCLAAYLGRVLCWSCHCAPSVLDGIGVFGGETNSSISISSCKYLWFSG